MTWNLKSFSEKFPHFNPSPHCRRTLGEKLNFNDRKNAILDLTSQDIRLHVSSCSTTSWPHRTEIIGNSITPKLTWNEICLGVWGLETRWRFRPAGWRSFLHVTSFGCGHGDYWVTFIMCVVYDFVCYEGLLSDFCANGMAFGYSGIRLRAASLDEPASINDAMGLLGVLF